MSELRKDYQRLKLRRGSGVAARPAIARKLAVRMYWMLRSQASYAQGLVRTQATPGGHPGDEVSHGSFQGLIGRLAFPEACREVQNNESWSEVA